MKFLCIRNFFIGSKTTRWTKGQWYTGRLPNRIEEANGIAFYIDSNDSLGGTATVEYFVKKKDFSAYFKTDSQVRDERISKILGVRDGDDGNHKIK